MPGSQLAAAAKGNPPDRCGSRLVPFVILAHKKSLLSLRETNTRQAAQQPTLNKKKSSILRSGPPTLTIGSILDKTYYKVDSHQPESLDWFNVLVAQTIAQFRSDAQHDDAILTSLTKALNGTSRPDFVDEIRVTELTLGEDFPIFSNCRIIPVDEDGVKLKSGADFDANMASRDGARLQARMDVDLSDMITLAVETKLLMNFPKRLSAVLPVALAVSVSGSVARCRYRSSRATRPRTRRQR